MRLALLGATGGIGGRLLAWALSEGHDVHVLARRPELLARRPGTLAPAAGPPPAADGRPLAADGRPPAAGRLTPAAEAPVPAAAGAAAVGGRPAAARLTVTAGDALDLGAVAEVVAGADAVLSALGPRGPRSTRVPSLLAGSAANLVAGMDRAGVRRLISVSAAGGFITGDPDTGWLIKAIIPRVFAAPFADVREMEATIRASGLTWTLVRAARLVNRPATGQYRIRADYPPPGGRKISRADVAHFIALALAQDAWLHAAPALAY
jgi:putative NADH-flavin reductase